MAARRKGLILSGVVFSALVSCFLRGATCDIPDDVVYTDLHKTVRIGDSVVLTCQFRGTPLAVYWKKGDDPKTAPNLVSWIPTDDVIGLCEGVRPCQIMEMNGNHSLVIKEVSIAEQGRYICRVSSYMGILIHNFTDIMIFSTPEEPYPIINQCANDSTQVCSISTNDSIKITCSATNFYPDLDLFFLHGSQQMTDIGSTELTNDDGTKNKSISIQASASKMPYICVASDIPGSKKQKAATIFVNSPLISTTRANGGLPAPSSSNAVTMGITPGTREITPRTMELTSGNRTTKIVVPIILVLAIGAVGLFAFFCWKHPRLFRRITTGNEQTGSNRATTSDPKERIPMVEKPTIAAPRKTVTLNAVKTYGACSLNRPHDVILHAGNYVITDTYNGRIICLSATKEYSVLYEAESPYLPFRPFSIAAVSENSFLITDLHHNKRKGNVFKLNSKKLSHFSSTYKDFETPTGITLDIKRDRVYIADSGQQCILVFEMDGTFLGRRAKGSLIDPWFIACNSQDQRYVTDEEGIKVFDPEWRYLTSLTINISKKTWCYRGIAIDACDNIFITARSRYSIIFPTEETVAAIDANHELVNECTVYTGLMFNHNYLRGVCIDYKRNRVVVVNGEKHTIATYTLY